MKVEDIIILLLVPVALIAMFSASAAADYVQTSVFFNVPTTISFSVTLPGQGAVNSNGTLPPNAPPTANIEFNSTNPTIVNIFPCVVGGGTCQSGAGSTGTPIFQYRNLGNTNISIQLIFNASLPSTVTTRANSSWDKSSLSNGTAFAGDRAVNATENTTLGTSIDWATTSVLNVYMYANFTVYPGGSRTKLLLNHTSV